MSAPSAEWLAWEVTANAVMRLHNGGGGSVLAPGLWCTEDGKDLPCPTLRAIAAVEPK